MKPNPPPPLWIALAALVVISLVQLAIGIAGGRLGLIFVGVPLNLALAYGLWRGFRWAFIVTMCFCFANGVLAVSKGTLTVPFIEGFLIVLPLILSRDYFFRRKPADPLRCPYCGYSLFGLTVPRCPECGAQFNLPG